MHVIGESQRNFFLELYREHGDDPLATSHGGREAQLERYRRLAMSFVSEQGSFDVHDVGCGLGHFGDFLTERWPDARYSGSEICAEFVDLCRQRMPEAEFAVRNLADETPSDRYDWVVACGIFNNRLDVEKEDWQEFVYSMLQSMFTMAKKGIAVDFLTTYHDSQLSRSDLHYQDEKALLDFVNSQLSRHYELDMSGPLYEYTLRIYRSEHVRALHGGRELERYFHGR